MILGEKVLAIIPARGGSKGVPGKNIRVVGGKPLIAWSIEAGKNSQFVDKVIVSTDAEEIIQIALNWGADVPFVRDTNLALDETSTIDVVFDVINRLPDYEWLIVLQPTSPLRTFDDIDNAIKQCIKLKSSSCVSVCKVTENPYWMYTLGEQSDLYPLFPNSQFNRRQELPLIYKLNGAIYLARTKWLKNQKKFIAEGTIAYEMSLENSIDLDTEEDFNQLKIIMEN